MTKRGPHVVSLEAVEDALRRGFLRGHALRREDTQKARELVPLLEEVARAADRRVKEPFVLVDACAGKSALGVLSAALVLGVREGPWRVVAIERVPERRQLALDAAQALGIRERVTFVDADVADATGWPDAPDIVTALHACGSATDGVIDQSIARGARRLLLVPCCYAAGRHGGGGHEPATGVVTAQPAADAWAGRMPLPRHGLVARRFSQAIIDAERTLRLEANGYETEVVEVFSPSVSPYNLLWRARKVGEPVRMKEAREKLDALTRS